jgi:hypothetical protein
LIATALLPGADPTPGIGATGTGTRPIDGFSETWARADGCISAVFINSFIFVCFSGGSMRGSMALRIVRAWP